MTRAIVRFRATCPTCLGWLGPERASTLEAERDFEAHEATDTRHGVGDPDTCGSCGHAVDDHDLRDYAANCLTGCPKCVEALGWRKPGREGPSEAVVY